MLGVLPLIDEPSTGLITATPLGAAESMVNVMVGLVPTLDEASVCDAVTV